MTIILHLCSYAAYTMVHFMDCLDALSFRKCLLELIETTQSARLNDFKNSQINV